MTRIFRTGRPLISGRIYSQIAMATSKRSVGNMATRGNTATQSMHIW
jgi:hypothetical protein